jgi:hypothetical protein
MRLLSLCLFPVALASSLALNLGTVAPARAGDFWRCNDTDYWCTRDAIYEKFKLIARLEANPDVDDGVKGPVITAARAEIHRLRATLGPPERPWSTPCCYARKPLYIR